MTKGEREGTRKLCGIPLTTSNTTKDKRRRKL
jgi:hypothetical protein